MRGLRDSGVFLVINPEAASISFHGPDACGKTSIASILNEKIHGLGLPTQKIGASYYKEWLTPDVADEFLGDSDRLSRPLREDSDKVRLYGDIAVAGYGLTHALTADGTNVIIDSDPYLKRLVWAYKDLGGGTAAYSSYASELTERIAAVTNGRVFTDWVIGVNVEGGHHSQENIETLLSRIDTRDTSTDYDPQTFIEANEIVSSCSAIWRNILQHEKESRGLCPRLISVHNVNCVPSQVSRNIDEIANNILEQTIGTN